MLGIKLILNRYMELIKAESIEQFEREMQELTIRGAHLIQMSVSSGICNLKVKKEEDHTHIGQANQRNTEEFYIIIWAIENETSFYVRQNLLQGYVIIPIQEVLEKYVLQRNINETVGKYYRS